MLIPAGISLALALSAGATRVLVVPTTTSAESLSAAVSDAVRKTPGYQLVTGPKVEKELRRCESKDLKCLRAAAKHVGADMVVTVWVSVDHNAEVTRIPLRDSDKSVAAYPNVLADDLSREGRHAFLTLISASNLNGWVMVRGGLGCSFAANGVSQPTISQYPVSYPEKTTVRVEALCGSVRSAEDVVIAYDQTRILEIVPDTQRLRMVTTMNGMPQAEIPVPPLVPTHKQPSTSTPSTTPPVVLAPEHPSSVGSSSTHPAAASSQVSKTESGPSGLRVASYVTAGVGVAALAVGVVEGLQVKSHNDDIAKYGPAAHQGDLDARQKLDSAYSSAKSASTVRNVAIVAGGAAVAAGVVMFFLSPSSNEPAKTTVGVAPLPDGAVVGLNGSF